MQPFAFCNRCRGMKVGWNSRYILHCLVCLEWLAKSTKTLVFTGLLSSFVFAFPVSTGVGPDARRGPVAEGPRGPATRSAICRAGGAVEKMLSPYEVDADRPGTGYSCHHGQQCQKYKTDPRLVASIVIVESGANAFAVSEADSVGIMQIHLGTWGENSRSKRTSTSSKSKTTWISV